MAFGSGAIGNGRSLREKKSMDEVEFPATSFVHSCFFWKWLSLVQEEESSRGLPSMDLSDTALMDRIFPSLEEKHRWDQHSWALPLVFRCGSISSKDPWKWMCNTFRFSLKLASFAVGKWYELYHVICFMTGIVKSYLGGGGCRFYKGMTEKAIASSWALRVLFCWRPPQRSSTATVMMIDETSS